MGLDQRHRQLLLELAHGAMQPARKPGVRRQQLQLLHLKDPKKVAALWATAPEAIAMQVSALRAEIPYYQKAIAAVKKLNKMISGP